CVIEKKGGIRDGDETTLSVKLGPIRKKWVARHFGYEPPRKFQDEQVEGPFKSEVHTHLCLPDPDGAANRSILVDHIDYEPPLGAIGRLFASGMIRRSFDQTFLFRHRRMQRDLARHARFASAGALRIAISGASGLIGTALKAFLRTGGHHVQVLVRHSPDRSKGEIQWDPVAGRIDGDALESVDAVVHLSGESLAAGRWTQERKQRFVESRLKSTDLLSRTLAGLKKPPRVMVSASAIGMYGNRGDEILTESSPKGAGFLPDLCEKWEAASRPAIDGGIRVVHPRIGIVMSARGGALATMLAPFMLGGGGVIGSGNQYMSWISLDDLVYVMHEAIFDTELSGPVNAVAPNPVTNREFVKTLGRVIKRPTVLPLPAPAVKLAFGEMGEHLLLEGARVSPARLESTGFAFAHPTLEDALRSELGRQRLPEGWGIVK
ncbi:MAG TPA: TIGR01777 family oxidoreductase, partial [Tepidisphaeraceae bacterium]